MEHSEGPPDVLALCRQIPPAGNFALRKQKHFAGGGAGTMEIPRPSSSG